MIEIVDKGGEPKKPSQTVMTIKSSEVKPIKNEKLVSKMKEIDNKPIVVVQGEPSRMVALKQEKAIVVVHGAAREPVIVVEGAHIDHVIVKPVIKPPIVNSKAVPWRYEQAIVMYKGTEVREEVCEAWGLTRSGRYFTPEELRKSRIPKYYPKSVKKAVSEEEVEEFLKKIKMQDYSIIERLRKTLAQISLLSFLIYSDEHRQALTNILNESHFPDKISVNHLENTANKIFEVNRVTFSDDELPGGH